MRRLIAGGVGVALAAACVLLASMLQHPAPAEPTQVVQAYLDAWERHDIDVARHYYPAARAFPPDFKLHVGALQTRGDEVTWVQTVRPPQSTRSTRLPINQRVTATVRNGQIVSIGTEQAPRDASGALVESSVASTVSLAQTIGLVVAVTAAVAGLLLLRTPSPVRPSEMHGRLISGLRQRLDDGWTPFA